MTEAELTQILERLERLEAEVRQLAEAVRQLRAAKAESAPTGDAVTLREPTALYVAAPREKEVIPTAHPHIVKIPGVQGGEPIVRGTQQTVREIVERTHAGMTAEEIVAYYGPPLSPAHIYDTLSYYHDHRDELDPIIARHGAAELEAALKRDAERAARLGLKPYESPPAPKEIFQTAHPYVVKIPGVQGGTPIIRDVYKTVWGIVELFQQGRTPEQIVQDKGEPLTLAQVYDALSYYFDNKGEIDQEIAEQNAALKEIIRTSREQQAEHARRAQRADDV
jgi:uncharacterized protein (DUF433 family)